MNHPVTVGVVQGARDLRRDTHRLFDGELLLARELVTQRLAPHIGQHIPHEPLALARVDEGEDVGVVEPGADADLSEEPLGAENRREFRAQDLERNVAIVPHVPGEIDRGHPAGAELALDRVAAGEGRGQADGLVHSKAGQPLQHADHPPATPATGRSSLKTGRPASLNAGRVPVTTFRPRPSQVVIYAPPADAATASSG